MTEYVLVHARCFDDGGANKVLLVLKDKPVWMSGKLNLCGGKVELGENIFDAAQRELLEETGLICVNGNMNYCGVIHGTDCIVYCVSIDVSPKKALIPREEETEAVAWYSWADIKNDERLLPNLRLIIPLLHMDSRGWSITDQNLYTEESIHRVSVDLYEDDDLEKVFPLCV